MGLVDQALNGLALLLGRLPWSGLQDFREDFPAARRLVVELVKEELQLVFGVLEATNQAETLLFVVVDELLGQLDLEGHCARTGVDLLGLGHELFGELRDVRREPTSEREALDVL